MADQFSVLGGTLAGIKNLNVGKLGVLVFLTVGYTHTGYFLPISGMENVYADLLDVRDHFSSV